MKPKDQIKALAELDGWEYEPWPCVLMHCDKLHDNWTKGDGPNKLATTRLSDYLTCYDAIIPLIQKQSVGIRLQVFVRLQEATNAAAFFLSTPSQLCESLLRATGRWTE